MTSALPDVREQLRRSTTSARMLLRTSSRQLDDASRRHPGTVSDSGEVEALIPEQATSAISFPRAAPEHAHAK
jgi:hypothetical protein